MRYQLPHHRKGKRTLPLRVWWLVGVLVVLIGGGIIAVHHVYNADLAAVSNNPKTQIFTVKQGASVKEIADALDSQNLIRSAWAMQLYVHSKNLSLSLQAGTYALSPNETTPEIVTIMTKGRVATELVTILPGRRIDQVRADLINYGFKPADVDAALNDLSQYSDLPVMAFKPANIDSLEGLLWPDSFEKDASTPPSYIIRESLIEMGQKLTPGVQAAFAREGLSTYQGLILTSIVEQEVNKVSDQPQVAQVFLTRYHNGGTLGSDVTATYGAVEAGRAPNLYYDSPWNTLIHPGLPPTPISTIDAHALSAAIHPASTDWLYFVTGDDGTTYFSNTLQQHQDNTAKYCHKLCASE
ncbi:MAG TPA: endolytic transglycosylase MltG [Candidatus Saccharimonadales bacterium]|nr:endolytic transglycosylase MltG [Candidatus Saccharimonadales bacterium]